jgi:FkbM family methyltransferase
MSDPILVSVHFPKAGGVSTRKLLSEAFGPAFLEDYQDDPHRPLSRRHLDPYGYMRLREPLPAGTRAVHGHFHPGKYLSLPEARWFTVLREPVDWMASLYWYWRSAAEGMLPQGPVIWGDLHEYVVRQSLGIEQTARLPIVSRMFSETYFGGFDMRRFEYIGDHSDRPRTMAALSQITGHLMAASRRENANPARPEIGETLNDSALTARLRDILGEQVDFYERWVGTGNVVPIEPAARPERPNVIAFVDDLDADPALLRSWGREITAREPVTLLLHPGAWSAERVQDSIVTMVAQAGIGDDDESAKLVALGGTVTAQHDEQLASQCIAVYGAAPAGGPFTSLPRLEPATVGRFGELLRASHEPRAAVTRTVSLRIKTEDDMPLQHSATTLTKPVRERFQRASLGQFGDFLHRGTDADRAVIHGVFSDRCYDLKHVSRFWPGAAALAAGATRTLIVDLGANIGASSLFLGLQCASATVVAVEPDADNFELLCANVERLPQVVPVERAIASEPGTVVLSDPGNGGWAICASNDFTRGEVVGSVQATTVQEIVDAHPDAEPFYLKVDIEGAEGDLFSGDCSAISRFPIVVVELHDRLFLGEGQQVSRSFLEWHVSQDRDFHQRGENTFSVDRRLRRGNAR